VEVQAWTTVDEVLERHQREAPGCSEGRHQAAATARPAAPAATIPKARDQDDCATAVSGTYEMTSRQLRTVAAAAATENADRPSSNNNMSRLQMESNVRSSSSSSRHEASMGTSGFFSQSTNCNTTAAAEYTSGAGPIRLTETERPEPTTPTPVNRTNAKHPDFVDLPQRIESFREKQIARGQTAGRLAKAGFFYVGPEDNVRCFQCDGGLKNWQPSDDPWTEHARWFPRCPFVQSQKDRDFIQNAQIARNNVGSQSFRTSNTSTSLTATSSAAAIGATQYRIEPREIKARMDSTTVQTVLKMGYQRDIVRQVIERRLRSTGDNFPSTQNLLEAVFELKTNWQVTDSNRPGYQLLQPHQQNTSQLPRTLLPLALVNLVSRHSNMRTLSTTFTSNSCCTLKPSRYVQLSAD
jgi:hypothetical protein